MPINTYSFNTSAECSILMDMDNHRILYGKNIHKSRSVASISKIMTAVIAIESTKLNDVVTIDDDILKAYGSAIYIKPGEKISLMDLVYGLMLRSGNDAAIAISKHVSGSIDEFVLAMNKKAKSIGMKNTLFTNPSGLDNVQGNYSSAYDMALLTSYAMENITYQHIVQTKKHTVTTNKNIYSWYNKNKLLSQYKYATGGKTGFTEKAKRTLVTTAKYKGLSLVAVTLNDGNDFADHLNLFKDAFATYTNVKILKKGNINIISDNYYNDKEFYIKNEFNYPISDSEKQGLYLKFELQKKRTLKSSEQVGIVKVMLGEKCIHEDNIYVKDESKEKRFFLLRWFKRDK